MKIAVLNDCFFTGRHINRLKALGELAVFETTNSEDLAIERLKDADIAIVDAFLTSYNKKVLDSTDNLKLLVLNTTSYTMVDLEAALAKEIKVANIPGFSSQAVAELTMGMLLAVNRKIPQGDERFRKHPYDDLDPVTNEGKYFIGADLKGKTMGVVGLGKIGSLVANLAQAFGMNVIAFNRSDKQISGVRMVGIEELLKSSDVVSLHVPLTKETEKIINKDKLSLMKPSAILLNISRRELVETDSLYQSLSKKEIRGAGLDVVEVTEKHPILELDNVVFTPHLGSYTEESFYKNLPDIVVSNVESFANGKPTNIVNP